MSRARKFYYEIVYEMCRPFSVFLRSTAEIEKVHSHDYLFGHIVSPTDSDVQATMYRLSQDFKTVVIKDQQAPWGSYTKNGTININWRIMMAPMRIVDYVVVHELSHMIHADHSSDFWAVVSSILPD